MWLVGKGLIPKAVVGHQVHYCQLPKMDVVNLTSVFRFET
jgi:hypothetical protein